MNALRALEHLLAVRGGPAAAERLRLLEQLRGQQFERAGQLVALQRIVCFLSAFPDNAAVHRAARQLARGFAQRVARLRRAQRTRLDDSGMAGSCTRHFYAAAATRWMQRRHAGAVDVDWSADTAADAVTALLSPLLGDAEAEAVDFSAGGLRDWIERAGGAAGDGALGWLLAQAGDGGARRTFDRAYDAAEVPLAWRLDEVAGVTGNALRVRLAWRGDSLRRASGDARAAIRQSLPVERCSRRATARLLDVWRAALWSRTRTVFQIEQPNLDECYLVDLGDGLQFAAIGVAPQRRGVLEATYGHLLLANGMPIGYGGFTALFAQVNTGINVFPEYRGSEAAFAFEQALRAMHAITGNSRFIVNPYQIGAGNDEALASGAYWFYYRLGFRSTDAALRAMADDEFSRLRAGRGYRVPRATLRRLAAADIHLDLTADAAAAFFAEAWLQDLAAGITAAIAGVGVRNRAQALRRLTVRIAAVLGIPPGGCSPVARRGVARFAPILAQIDDLEDWSAADRDALAEIVLGRWAPQEREFVDRMRRHVRLREALAAAGLRARRNGRQGAA